MKSTLILVTLLALVLASHKHRHRQEPAFRMNPGQEKHRLNQWGSVNTSPEMMNMLRQKGVTANYT